MVIAHIFYSNQSNITILYPEAVAQRCSVKKVFFQILQNSQKITFAWVSFLIKLQDVFLNFIKKETLAQVFSCKFCKICKNICFSRTPQVAVSISPKNI